MNKISIFSVALSLLTCFATQASENLVESNSTADTSIDEPSTEAVDTPKQVKKKRRGSHGKKFGGRKAPSGSNECTAQLNAANNTTSVPAEVETASTLETPATTEPTSSSETSPASA
jgi:hypothetical protein